MKQSKVNFWIKQLRRPLCLLLVLTIVFIYGFSVHAEEPATTYDVLGTYYNISTTGSVPLFWPQMKTSYINDGNDLSKLNHVVLPNNETTYAYMQLGTYNKLFPEQILENAITGYNNNLLNINLVNTFTRDGIPYDFTNAYTFTFSESYTWTYPSVIMRCKGDGYFAIVDGYLVSDQAFSYITYYATDYNNPSGITPGNCSSADSSGFYRVFLESFYNAYGVVSFTDLDIYFSSIDASSGFTDGNFVFSNTSNYYNFNFLKTGGFIVSPADPQEPAVNDTGKHYNYGFATSSVYGSPFDSLYVGTTLSFNNYMKSHANQYFVCFENTVGLRTSGETAVSYFTDGGGYFSLDRLVRNGTYSFNVFIDTGLWMKGGVSMSAYLRAAYGSITNTSPGYYSDSDWSVDSDPLSVNFLFPDYKQYNYKGLKNTLIGSGKLEVANITTKVYFVFNSDGDYNIEEENKSGSYVVTFNLLTGDYYVGQNDISNNLDPLEDPLENYPIDYTNGGTVVPSGNSGSNVISNSSINNFTAAIEYLFNIDITDLQNLQGNMADNYNFVLRNVADTSSNGFWAVLTETYDLIPEDIWTWIKTAVAAILMCSVYRVYISHYRLKG